MTRIRCNETRSGRKYRQGWSVQKRFDYELMGVHWYEFNIKHGHYSYSRGALYMAKRRMQKRLALATSHAELIDDPVVKAKALIELSAARDLCDKIMTG